MAKLQLRRIGATKRSEAEPARRVGGRHRKQENGAVGALATKLIRPLLLVFLSIKIGRVRAFLIICVIRRIFKDIFTIQT
jgi:hypothetical protein